MKKPTIPPDPGTSITDPHDFRAAFGAHMHGHVKLWLWYLTWPLHPVVDGAVRLWRRLRSGRQPA